MAHNQLFTEQVAVLETIDPDAATNATYVTSWVDLSIWDKVAFLVLAGTLGSSATIDAKLEQSTTSAGAGPVKDVTSKLITQLTQAGTDSNKQSWINCRADQLDIANDYRYVRGSLTVGTAACDCGAVLFGMNCKYGPASDHDVSTVDEIVA